MPHYYLEICTCSQSLDRVMCNYLMSHLYVWRLLFSYFPLYLSKKFLPYHKNVDIERIANNQCQHYHVRTCKAKRERSKTFWPLLTYVV